MGGHAGGRGRRAVQKIEHSVVWIFHDKGAVGRHVAGGVLRIAGKAAGILAGCLRHHEPTHRPGRIYPGLQGMGFAINGDFERQSAAFRTFQCTGNSLSCGHHAANFILRDFAARGFCMFDQQIHHAVFFQHAARHGFSQITHSRCIGHFVGSLCPRLQHMVVE